MKNSEPAADHDRRLHAATVREVVAEIVESTIRETTFIDDIKVMMVIALVDAIADRVVERLPVATATRDVPSDLETSRESAPAEVDLEGLRDHKDPGIRYLGRATRQLNGEYLVLADVHGALCRVAVRLTPENPSVTAHSGEKISGAPTVKTTLRDVLRKALSLVDHGDVVIMRTGRSGQVRLSGRGLARAEMRYVCDEHHVGILRPECSWFTFEGFSVDAVLADDWKIVDDWKTVDE